jgi:hypothetical protein
MLGIGCPDRHALPRITLSKMRQPRRVLPSRASGFVHRRRGDTDCGDRRWSALCPEAGCISDAVDMIARTTARNEINLLGVCESVILHVTYSERGERIRIISVRRAERHEQDDYYRENAR